MMLSAGQSSYELHFTCSVEKTVLHLEDDRQAGDHYPRKADNVQVETLTMDSYKARCVGSKLETLSDCIIHLYKVDEPVAPGTLCSEQDSRVVAILAVPSYMTAADLMGYIGVDVQKRLSHIQMLRTEQRNRYMTLLLFYQSTGASDFLNRYNGRAFNSAEPETAHCVRLTGISIRGTLRPADEFPLLLDEDSDAVSRANFGKRPLAPITASLTELPTCVICLERMDSSVTGLLTILCDHTFHCNCISRWVDKQSTCPICRFSVAKEILEDPEKVCSACDSPKNLWMCLICGNIACGRYESQHAIGHFERTRHAFAMDLASSRIWDYSSDCYVHRIVQEKLGAIPVDGKFDKWHADAEHDHGAEFEALLTTQLESQRIFYEAQLKALADRVKQAQQKEESMLKHSSETLEELRLLKVKFKTSRSDLIRSEEAQKSTNSRCTVLSNLVQQLKARYKEEASISASLMSRIKHLEAINEAATQDKDRMSHDIGELQEQMQDLMVHLTTSQKIQQSSEDTKHDLKEGSISLGRRQFFKR